ncbi:MAG: hypothetical protein IKR19_07965 [Acholeplasmatales bacterium]|nr:hypothetical protein [Acholeplasmatales bacterium]
MEQVSIVRCYLCGNCIITTSGLCSNTEAYNVSYYCSKLHASVNPMFFCAYCSEKRN